MAEKKEDRKVSNQLPLEDQNDAFEHLMNALEDVDAANDDEGDMYAAFDNMQELPDELENEIAGLLDSDVPDEVDDDFSVLIATSGSSVDHLLESLDDDEPTVPERSSSRAEVGPRSLAESGGDEWVETDDIDTELVISATKKKAGEIDHEMDAGVEEFELLEEVAAMPDSGQEPPRGESSTIDDVAIDAFQQGDSEPLEVRGYDDGAFASMVAKASEAAEASVSQSETSQPIELGPEIIMPAAAASAVDYELPGRGDDLVEEMRVADIVLTPRSAKPSAAGSTVNFLGLVAGLVGLAFGAIAIWSVSGVSDDMAALKQSVAQVSDEMVTRQQDLKDLRRSAMSVSMLETALGDMGNQVESVRDEVVSVRSDLMHQSELVTAAFGRLQKAENDLANTQVEVAAQTEKVMSLGEQATVLATTPVTVVSKKTVPPKQSAATPAAALPVGWAVNLGTYGGQAQAIAEAKRLQQSGIKAVVSEAGAGKFRIQVGGFGDYQSAKSAVAGIQQRSAVKGAWVAKAPNQEAQ